MTGNRKLLIAIISICASMVMFIAMCYRFENIDSGALTMFFAGFFGMIAGFFGANAIGDHGIFTKKKE